MPCAVSNTARPVSKASWILALALPLSPIIGRADLIRGGPSSSAVNLAAASDDPVWGCGLVGRIPGISESGEATAETQRVIDGMRASSTFGKATYWNWNYAPETTSTGAQFLTKDFIFMPENWGAGVAQDQYVRIAGTSNFLDSDGKVCPAEMGTVFLGSNEPDIQGSCMGDMFGKCNAPCTDAEVGDCPEAHLNRSAPAMPNAAGHCNCWEDSKATGVGFWPLEGCAGLQPLPHVWDDAACVQQVMTNWRQTAKIAHAKGYKYLSTPLVASDVDYARKFLEHACSCANGECACTDASCGCPVYVGVHFYAYDCQPQATDSWAIFDQKIQAVARIMEDYHFVKGAIMNEVGMLNCQPPGQDPICVPNGGTYPASLTSDGGCPPTDELPNGLASFVERLFERVIQAKTSDGRLVMKGFSWFNEDRAGGTYNLQLFDSGTGMVNSVGEAYIDGCERWGEALRKAGYAFSA